MVANKIAPLRNKLCFRVLGAELMRRSMQRFDQYFRRVTPIVIKMHPDMFVCVKHQQLFNLYSNDWSVNETIIVCTEARCAKAKN